MDENTNKPEKPQGPVCAFCYKWCPRMLMLVGIIAVINTLCLCFFDIPHEIYAHLVGYDDVVRARLNGFQDTLEPKLIIPYIYYYTEDLARIISCVCYNTTVILATLITVIASILKLCKASI